MQMLRRQHFWTDAAEAEKAWTPSDADAKPWCCMQKSHSSAAQVDLIKYDVEASGGEASPDLLLAWSFAGRRLCLRRRRVPRPRWNRELNCRTRIRALQYS